MTKKEMKNLLNEKCNETWNVLKAFEHEYGKTDIRSEKFRTKWVTYDDLYRELYNEAPHYNF